MKLKKVILEITDSGIIPVICGASIMLNESSLPNPSFAWQLFGLGLTFVGLFLGDKYMNKQSLDTHETEETQ